MKRLSWKYVAGLIDGEGCIDVAVSTNPYGTYISPRVRICLTDKARFVLEILQTNHDGSLQSRPKPTNPNWDTATSWELTGYKKVCMLLRNLVNSLLIKKEQARLILWMETHLKGRKLSQEGIETVKREFTLLKRDPHRLSEKAQEAIKPFCDAIVGPIEL